MTVDLEPPYAAIHGSPHLGRWVRASELSSRDSPLLPELIAEVGCMWSGSPAVAAALWWKQYSWYVVDAAIAGWQAGRLPDLAPEVTRVRFGASFPFVLVRPGEPVDSGDEVPAAEIPEHGVTAAAGRVLPETELANRLSADVIEGHLAPIVARLHELTRVGERTLWGSVAHAIGLPLFRVLPEPETVVPRLLQAIGPPVDGLIDVTPDGIVRRTCCLAFRSKDPAVRGICSYCPIAQAG